MAGFATEIYFSTFWSLEAQDQATSRLSVWRESAFCFMCLHTEKGCRRGISFARALIPTPRAPPSLHNHLLKASPPNTIALGIRFPHMNVGGTQTLSLVFITPPRFLPLELYTTAPPPRHLRPESREPWSSKAAFPNTLSSNEWSMNPHHPPSSPTISWSPRGWGGLLKVSQASPLALGH